MNPEINPEFRFATVMGVDDETGGGRILVQMMSRADSIEGPSYAFPLLPKVFHVKPKVGECVLIVSQDLTKPSTQRYYIGPIISQPQYFNYDARDNSTRLLGSKVNGADENPILTKYKEVAGTQPGNGDVAILSRRDSDIILKDNELNIRCGVKSTNPYDTKEFKFNGEHPAFIKLQHEPNPTISENNQYESSVNIVADKINLIGTDSREKFKIYDKDKNNDLLNTEEVKAFIEKAHELPYGDTLVEFLDIFRKAFLMHEHSWAQKPPTPCPEVNALRGYQLNDILSDTVRIN